MTTTPMTTGHLPDGDLVRLLDGEMDAPERTHTEAHLAACAECRRRLKTLRRRSIRLGELLIASDWEIPPLRPPRAAPASHSWLRAAALVAVLLGAVMLASPARAWIAEWVGARWNALASAPEAAPGPQTPPVQQAGPGTRVQFTPTGDEFDLEFTTRQAGGTVRVEPHGAAFVSAEVLRDDVGTDLLVLPNGLRVRNAAESTAEYRVMVPAHLRRVRVRVAGDAPTVLTGEEIRGGRTIDLRGADLRTRSRN